MEKTDELPQNEWRLAKVVETVTDKDALVRRADLSLRPEDGKSGTAFWKKEGVELFVVWHLADMGTRSVSISFHCVSLIIILFYSSSEFENVRV